MKKHSILSLLLAISLTTFAQQRLAFPTAEGAGRYTWGGREGKVLVVNRLDDDSNPGSLRWAVEQTGARTVIFDVSGDIILNDVLRITNDSITIAGQTAPGDGITIRNHTVFVAANQVIVRYMRFRPGDELDVEIDAFEGRGQSDIIIDHCSMSWANDEVTSWYNNRNFTLQWSIISEPLHDAGHEKGLHGFGGIWGGNPGTFHHNLIAHCSNRSPRFNGARLRFWDRWGENSELVEFSNNVIYNWGDFDNFYGGEGGRYNIRNNYFKPGPATPAGSASRNRFFLAYARVDHNAGGQGVFVDYGNFYMNGNFMVGNATISNDNWAGNGMSLDPPIRFETINGRRTFVTDHTLTSRQNIDAVRQTTPFPVLDINLQTAHEAYEAVLAKAGASLRRDTVDARIVHETRTGTAPFGRNGHIDSPTDVGAWPTLNNETPAFRTNKGTPLDDGIPDAWKIARGLPLNQNVANLYNLSNVYTNLEIYLNSLVADTHR